jgi:1-pyrroline-5-carboxylate dehydrogenase
MPVPAGRTALFPIGPTAPCQFAPGSPERRATAGALAEARTAAYDVPNLVGSQQVRTGRTAPVSIPHDHASHIGQVHYASPANVTAAIEAALAASRWWSRLPWEERAAPFLRAADMLQYGPWRERLNAATMLELSKTTYQADIDAACETIDFIRANVKNMLDMYDVQPGSLPGMWNQVEYRPLEGFVLAITPPSPVGVSMARASHRRRNHDQQDQDPESRVGRRLRRRIYAIRNPDKLGWLEKVAELSR